MPSISGVCGVGHARRKMKVDIGVVLDVNRSARLCLTSICVFVQNERIQNGIDAKLHILVAKFVARHSEMVLVARTLALFYAIQGLVQSVRPKPNVNVHVVNRRSWLNADHQTHCFVVNYVASSSHVSCIHAKKHVILAHVNSAHSLFNKTASVVRAIGNYHVLLNIQKTRNFLVIWFAIKN